MGSVKEYFSTLGTGIASLLKGMKVTGKEFVTPKITERYPEDRTTRPAAAPRFRAELNGTTTVETKMVTTMQGTKKKKLVKYLYDLGSCTFCQLCVSGCPTDALEFSNDFEQAVFTRDALVKQLNYLPEKPEPEPTPEQLAKIEAERQAKVAAAKAAAAAKASAAPAAGAAQATKEENK